MNEITITRTWMILQIKRGLSLEQIALERGVSVSRIRQALEHFQLNYPKRGLFGGPGKLAG